MGFNCTEEHEKCTVKRSLIATFTKGFRGCTVFMSLMENKLICYVFSSGDWEGARYFRRSVSNLLV